MTQMQTPSTLQRAKFYEFDHQPLPDSCWSLAAGPDGRIYAASCCEHAGGGGVYIVRYNDEADRLDTILDIPEVVGEPRESGRATQCKIHYSFAPSKADGILYMATHLSAPGYKRRRYSAWGDWKDDRTSFPGAVLVAYDTTRDEVAWCDRLFPREGCRCLALDEERGLLYAISYPRDHFWVYDLKTRTVRDKGRLGSVNSQAIFTDRRGRAYTTNDHGQIVRYDPETDELRETPVYLPYSPELRNGWHTVIYDVVGSPEGDCVYGVPWSANPHLFRYWPEEGEFGRMEDLGPVHQKRDQTVSISYYLDHCGGLVFGADGKLYMGTTRWTPGQEHAVRNVEGELCYQTQQIIVRMDPQTLQREDFALAEKPQATGNYISRAGRDRFGNLFFGHVNRPIPVGITRLEMGASGTNLHLPLRTWG